MLTHAAVPLPQRMAHLPVDPRGFPIPLVVQRDKAGNPIFQVNNTEVRRRCIRQKLCHICGDKLGKELWFAGGPGSALHPYGAYIDSAMHHECVTYALQVCPYLAIRTYQSRLHTDIALNRLHGKMGHALLVDETVDPERPEVFVLVMSYGQSLLENGKHLPPHLRPLRPYHAVEFWKDGKRLDYREGREIVSQKRGYDLSVLRLVDERHSK